MSNLRILQGHCIDEMEWIPDNSIQTCVTSPPYFGLRDYGHEGQIGLEATPDEYVTKMVEVFREVRRVLRDDGTLWLNLGDMYGRGKRTENPSDAKRGTGFHAVVTKARGYGAPVLKQILENKQLLGVPWRVAFALQADGWYLRQDIIWHKPNPMPESVRDRCTKAHEYIFLMSKSQRYYFDSDAMKEPATHAGKRVKLGEKSFAKRQADGSKVAPSGNAIADYYDCSQYRNRRSVWTVATRPFKGAHFAAYPPELIEPCVLAGSRPGDTVLDPFGGSGTTAAVALKNGRKAITCELNPEYIQLIEQRTQQAIAEYDEL